MSQIYNGRKRSILIMHRHKTMRIPDRTCKDKKSLVTINSKNVYEMKFTDHLLLTFLDQPQSDIVSFEIFYLDM